MQPIFLKVNSKTFVYYKNHLQLYSYFWNIVNNDDLTKAILAEVNVTDDEWQQVLNLIELGESNIEDNSRVTGGYLFSLILNYSKQVEEDPVLRDIVLNRNDTYWALEYCSKLKKNDPQMRQIIIDSQSPEYALYWCRDIDKNDADMRQIVLKNHRNARNAFGWCRDIGDDADMRQVVLDSKDPEWALDYCVYISDDTEMRNIILNR